MGRSFVVVFAGALAMGCGSSEGVGGRPSSGLLGGSGTSRPECGALSQGCMGQGLDAPIALGSTLEIAIDYKIAGASGPPTKIETANPLVLKGEGGTRVTAAGEGMSALFFVGPDGMIIDFLHVWVARPDELRVLRYSSGGALLGPVQERAQLLVGDEILVSVETYGGGQALLGNYPLTYTASSNAVRIVPDPVAGWYRVVAREAGTASLAFEALGMKKTWALEVLP